MELGYGSCIEIHSVSVSGLLLIIDLGLSRFSQVQGSETYSKKKKNSSGNGKRERNNNNNGNTPIKGARKPFTC